MRGLTAPPTTGGHFWPSPTSPVASGHGSSYSLLQSHSFSKELCELAGVLAKGRRVSVHHAGTVYEIAFAFIPRRSPSFNAISFWQTDPKRVVKASASLCSFQRSGRTYFVNSSTIRNTAHTTLSSASLSTSPYRSRRRHSTSSRKSDRDVKSWVCFLLASEFAVELMLNRHRGFERIQVRRLIA